MEKSYFIKLTQAVYRTTDLFPDGESLKMRIRDKANEILTDLVLNDPQAKEQTLKAIEILESYFEIARIQNWVNSLNFIILEQEYEKIAEELKKEQVPHKREKNNELSNETNIEKEKNRGDNQGLTIQPVRLPMIIAKEEKDDKHSERHQKILDFLKEKGQAQVWEVKGVLADVSKRTIRRDFEYLVEQNLVQRIGEKNNTFYKSR